MEYSIYWTVLSKQSFNDEVEFIYFKWNNHEVIKFIALVDETLETLALKPTIGIFNQKRNNYSFVVSKQNTLFYKINNEKHQIELVLFWNTSQNLIRLEKFLKI